ncbi:HAMP domain-containing histidine kinase [Flavobacterium sufflavum]|uniref:histidine kinase n=1 Tax=Flavobacterium sufflavum TaxID=1921138 RepID=A0A3S2XG63_9FLAO|nr:HAMP domain-containing sensor histidine kinase [Flavobacterium sufflavum]RVT78213.1 HAMP domain-containing histidine kinase [Flavobacterium sufflavum]
MIKISSLSRAFFLKKLKFEHRKIIHYTLLTSVILLQITAIVIWYNETKNETKLSNALEEISSSKKIINYADLAKTSLIQSQEHFNNYLNNRNEISFKKYSSSLNDISHLLDSLHFLTNGKLAYKKIILKKDQTQAEISILKSTIDSIINSQINKSHDETSKLFKFTKFESKKILDSVKTDSYIKVDSVSRKGLLARLGDAFAGRLNVQKEQLNTVVTMKYKDRVISGSIEDQLKTVFHKTNNYYQNEFLNLKKSFLDLRDKDSQLIALNNELLKISQNVISDYKSSADLLQTDNENNIVNQYKSNKIVRSYSIIFLITIMFIVSIILLSFTHLTFEYEKRLIAAQNQIRQSLIFKNRIMGMISHEIRSPLNIISMYSRKVRSLIKEKELKDTFKSIEFTTNSLLLLSNQILEYSKDENKKLNLKNRNLYLKTEIYQIISSMSSLAEVKGNKIKILSNLDSDCEVYTDVTKIHQLFYNIIGNANKFTENGNIIVTINIQDISHYEMDLQIEVNDDGIGINPNDLENIFESYYQGIVSRKVNDLGVGLGLNLCKEIVQLFDGKINIQSEEGKGTTVKFNLILSKV